MTHKYSNDINKKIMNTAPLQGIKVIDFTEVQSGPSCTQLLAWLGAEVIKIERPGVGDATRNELQFDPDCPSYYFLQLNSDKKSLALDAKTPDGKAILTKLIAGADVLSKIFIRAPWISSDSAGKRCTRSILDVSTAL